MMRSVARSLGVALGRDTVLFDEFVKSKVVGPDARRRLAKMFRDDVDLVVAVVDRDYLSREWCRVEWQSIVARMQLGRPVLVVRCEDVTLPNWPESGWALDGRGMDAATLTQNILSHLREVVVSSPASRWRVSLAVGLAALVATLTLAPSVAPPSLARMTNTVEPLPQVKTLGLQEAPAEGVAGELISFYEAEWRRVVNVLTRQERAEVVRDWAVVEASARRGAIGPTFAAVKQLNQRLAGLDAERVAARRRIQHGRGECAAWTPIPRFHQLVMSDGRPRREVEQPIVPMPTPIEEPPSDVDQLARARVVVTRRSSGGVLAAASLEPDRPLPAPEQTIYEVSNGGAPTVLLLHDPASGGVWPLAGSSATASRRSFVVPLPPMAFGALRVFVVQWGDSSGYAELTDLPLGVPSSRALRPLPGA